ncbi:MAG: hypothetical protein KGQ60_17790, partial [Planctomycetes bacterium]|nr:hypothetical protein [Planctomycetota bacterium]
MRSRSEGGHGAEEIFRGAPLTKMRPSLLGDKRCVALARMKETRVIDVIQYSGVRKRVHGGACVVSESAEYLGVGGSNQIGFGSSTLLGRFGIGGNGGRIRIILRIGTDEVGSVFVPSVP